MKLFKLFAFGLLINIFISSYCFALDDVELAGDIVLAGLVGATSGSIVYMKDKDGAVQYGESALSNLGLTYGLKTTIDKKRPNGKKGSFPSAHTSVAFQNAVFVHKRYGLKKAIPLYLGASFVGFSRVESKQHYVEDVLAGAGLGALCSMYFTKPTNVISVVPVVESKFYGVFVNLKW
ncbi:phosphatase PAP2 family protein [Deferribacteraceae bacterium V6Fe1]|nr:phosphatase PAP2 family protein [Deferribacteraceae bacterium V6Fe1]